MKQNNTLLLAGGLLAAFFLLKPETAEKAAGSVTNVFGGDSGGLIPDFGSAAGGGLLPDIGLFDNIFSDIADTLKGLQDQVSELAKNTTKTVTESVSGLGGNGVDGGNYGAGGIAGLFDIVKMAIGEPANIILSLGESVKTGGGGVADIGKGAVDIGKGAAILAGTYVGTKAVLPVVPTIGRGLATVVGAGGRALVTPVSALPILGSTLAVVSAGATGYYLGTRFNATPAGQSLQKWSGEQGASFSHTSLGKWLWKRNEVSEYGESINVPKNWSTMTQKERQDHLRTQTSTVAVRTSAPAPKPKYITTEAGIWTVENGQRRRGL